MTSFFGELKRRHVFRVAVAYAIVSWILVEVSSVLGPALNLPDWATSLVVFFVLLGFPLALILSWAYDLTPQGIERTKSVPMPGSITQATGRKFDFVVIGLMTVGIAFLVVNNYLLEDDSGEASETAVGVLPNSIAVLPFENLSPDPDNAYYAAGIHEEILNQLAKLSALNVIARTSMRQYANTDKSIPEIASELNVETVMEGSVRYDAGRIRITTQLNDGVTGAHIWSETYTREFDDIFAIESDVATNVANALEAEFSLEEQLKIEELPTNSPAAYALYLKARSEFTNNARLIRNRMEPLLLDAIDLDPEFALAYGWLAFVYGYVLEEALTLEYAEKALELDPDLGLAYAAISTMYYLTSRFEEALQSSELAIQLSPSDPFVNTVYAEVLIATGNEEEALRVREQATRLDPANANAFSNLGMTRWIVGDRDGGIVAMRRAVQLAPESVNSHEMLGMMEAVLGNRAEGVAQLRLAERLAPNDERPNVVVAYHYRVVELHEDAARIARAWAESGQQAPQGAAELMRLFYYLVLDDEEQALDALVQLIEAPSGVFIPPFTYVITNVWDDPTLEKPEFQELRANLRAKFGWN